MTGGSELAGSGACMGAYDLSNKLRPAIASANLHGPVVQGSARLEALASCLVA
jgi:hypothetical protein